MKKIVSINYFGFQSPRSGKFVSNQKTIPAGFLIADGRFQSPRSGKFVSDIKGFTPLAILSQTTGFNPLNRGNLYQIIMSFSITNKMAMEAFQSPRSGKFVSDKIIYPAFCSKGVYSASIP